MGAEASGDDPPTSLLACMQIYIFHNCYCNCLSQLFVPLCFVWFPLRSRPATSSGYSGSGMGMAMVIMVFPDPTECHPEGLLHVTGSASKTVEQTVKLLTIIALVRELKENYLYTINKFYLENISNLLVSCVSFWSPPPLSTFLGLATIKKVPTELNLSCCSCDGYKGRLVWSSRTVERWQWPL